MKRELKATAESLIYWLGAEWKRQAPRIARDASPYTPREMLSSNPPASVYAAITKRFDAEKTRWQKRCRESAERFGGRFMDTTKKETIEALNRNFKKAGLSTVVKPSRVSGAIASLQKKKVIDTVDAVLQLFVQRSLTDALERFIRGEAAKDMEKGIRRNLEKSERQAGNVSRGLASNTVNTLTDAYNSDLGLDKAVWVHVPGKRYSRKTHEEMNGKVFDRKVGLYDREVKKNVKPGELQFCMCTYRVLVPDWLK